MYNKIIRLFLRLAIAAGFLSAVADRFGLWHSRVAWGSWEVFVEYTHSLLPWLSDTGAQAAAILATVAEALFAIFLLVGWKTKLFAILSGALLLSFAIAMAFSLGIKAPLDYSVFPAAAAAFALSAMKGRYLELDSLVSGEQDA